MYNFPVWWCQFSRRANSKIFIHYNCFILCCNTSSYKTCFVTLNFLLLRLHWTKRCLVHTHRQMDASVLKKKNYYLLAWLQLYHKSILVTYTYKMPYLHSHTIVPLSYTRKWKGRMTMPWSTCTYESIQAKRGLLSIVQKDIITPCICTMHNI